MGLCSSTRSKATSHERAYKFKKIPDHFETVAEVQQALVEEGLEGSQLIVGVDFTKSNEWTGTKTFRGLPLHSLELGTNQYLDVISIMARTLASFDDDKLIPCYGFGDVTSGGQRVFSFLPRDQPLYHLEGVVGRYRQIAPLVDMSGPTSFAPVILQAIRTVVNGGMGYHVLVIVADGQVSPSCAGETIRAIELASHFPLSIILVGVGDGPWEKMRQFDDKLPRRKFDNFQFVEFHKIMSMLAGVDQEKQLAQFALHAMMELPEQYKAITRLGLLAKRATAPRETEGLVLDPPPKVLMADSNQPVQMPTGIH